MKQNTQIWRIFIDDFADTSQFIDIEGDEFHFLHNVLRLRPGEQLEIADGKGTIAQTSIEKIEKKYARVIIDDIKKIPKPEIEINICVGLPKTSATEEVVSLISELGATKIMFFVADKTHGKQTPKLDRLNKLAREALRISKSAWETQIEIYENLASLTKTNNLKEFTSLMCDENSTEKYLSQALVSSTPTSKIFIFIGPEASFSDAEKNMLLAAGAIPVTLGTNILRVPTATAAATVLALNAVNTKRH